MESRSFPSNFDIAGRYAKHPEQDYLRYGEPGHFGTTSCYAPAKRRVYTLHVVNHKKEQVIVSFSVRKRDNIYK